LSFRFVVIHDLISFLLWRSLTPRPEQSVLAVHRCTAAKPVKSYAEKFGKFSKQKATKAAKTRFGDPPEE
jgi:hypothetical protein